MKNKYRIGFITFTILSILVLSFAYYFSSRSMINQLTSKDVLPKETDTLEPVDGQALKQNCFYVMKLNDYIVVYESDRKTIYEYTDIIFEELPSSLKKEIKNGKYIENLEELYGFLENYSS